MILPQQKQGLYLEKTNGKGHGLFCEKHIDTKETIESCIALPFNQEEALEIDKTNLYNYYFSLNFLTVDQAKMLNITNKDKAGCLALGNMSFANHSESPNAFVEKEFYDNKIIFTLKAKRKILAKEEITISYGQVWFDLT